MVEETEPLEPPPTSSATLAFKGTRLPSLSVAVVMIEIDLNLVVFFLE